MYILHGIVDEVTEAVHPDLRGRQRHPTLFVESELTLAPDKQQIDVTHGVLHRRL